MHFHFELLLLAFTGLTQGVPFTKRSIERRAVDYKSLKGLTKLDKDMSGSNSDIPGKYFHESTFHTHYDGRFTKTILPPKLQLFHLRFLLSSYLKTLDSLKVETWIMHGTLLGWWWNQRIMPWDTDLDVQVDERGIKFLAEWHNMTVHSFTPSDLGISDPSAKPDDIHDTEWQKVVKNGKRFLLEVNPHWVDDSELDILNVIDARWIDVDTGLFIDITALRSAHNPANLEEMRCKDQHHYLGSQIFPLRMSELEGLPVMVPYAYKELLEEEYGRKSLTRTRFEGYEFDGVRREWVKFGSVEGGKEQKQLQEEDEGEDEDDETYR